MKIPAGLALAALLALGAVPTTHADEFNQATEVNFSNAIRMPGRVLPAGSYWFVLADHGRDPNVVQVLSADRTRLVGSFLTDTTERLEATGRTVLVFAEPDSAANPRGDMPALTKWFYPGRDVGSQFAYSNGTERLFRHEAQVTVPVGESGAVVRGD